VIAHAVRGDPAQLHGESPFHVVSTPRHQRSPQPQAAPGAEEQF
jgi:hypothetical protein